MKYNAALIGAGNMAQSYLDVLKATKKFNILGSYSRNKKKLKKFALLNKIDFFSNLKFINHLNDKDLLIVSVTAPNLIKVINLIYKAKCVVILEKPLGINLLEAKKIYNKIKFKKNFFLALNRRYYGSTIDVKKKISNKKKRYIYIEDHINYKKTKKLGFNEKNKKFFVFSHSIHLIDYFNIFARGKITSLKINKIKNRNLVCNLKYDSGDVGIYKFFSNSNQKWKVLILNNNKQYVLQPLEKLNLLYNQKKKIISYLYDKKYKPGLMKLILDVLNRIENKNNNLISLEKGLSIMKLINDIHFSRK